MKDFAIAISRAVHSLGGLEKFDYDEAVIDKISIATDWEKGKN